MHFTLPVGNDVADFSGNPTRQRGTFCDLSAPSLTLRVTKHWKMRHMNPLRRPPGGRVKSFGKPVQNQCSEGA